MASSRVSHYHFNIFASGFVARPAEGMAQIPTRFMCGILQEREALSKAPPSGR